MKLNRPPVVGDKRRSEVIFVRWREKRAAPQQHQRLPEPVDILDVRQHPKQITAAPDENTCGRLSD